MLDIKEDLYDEDDPIVLPAVIIDQAKLKEQQIEQDRKNFITRGGELYIDIEEPIVAELFEAEPVPAIRGHMLSHAERLAAEKEALDQGFMEGTVVTSARGNAWARVNPQNWGIVIDTISYQYNYHENRFAPIKVQWVSDGGITYCWPDEIIMVSPAPDSADLEMIKNGE